MLYTPFFVVINMFHTMLKSPIFVQNLETNQHLLCHIGPQIFLRRVCGPMWYYFCCFVSRFRQKRQKSILKQILTQKCNKKYVGVQSWNAAHLPTLEIRAEKKGNCFFIKTAKYMLFKKNLEKIAKVFFDFAIFPIEIFLGKRGLRMQSFISVGQTVPEVLEERQILYKLLLWERTAKK